MDEEFPETVRRLLREQAPEEEGACSLTPTAVLLLLFRKDGQYHIILTKRTEQVERHKGEVCFPGGARDPGDRDLVVTALRETREELGVDPAHVTVLGELPPVSTRSGFTIKPFVGLIPYPYPLTPNRAEVAEVLEAPLTALLHPAALREEMHWERGKGTRGYNFAFQGHVIFGATARILARFLEVAAAALEQETPWPSERGASKP